jgi:hypothetical protein
MELIHALSIVVLSLGAGEARVQDPPPPPPPQTRSAPSQSQAPPSAQTAPQIPSAPAQAPAPPAATLPPLTRDELRQRRNAIYLMEGVLEAAVRVGAQKTVSEIQRVEPGLVMFSSSPVKAHGNHLEDYGVFFQVEIPSVIPSVASLLAQRERARPDTSPAQPTSLSASSQGAVMNPDAHYVESVKQELINAMVRLSHTMDLRSDEWLTVAARDGSEVPGQLAEPSTMILRIKGSDLADFFAGRILIDEARKRVQVSGF